MVMGIPFIAVVKHQRAKEYFNNYEQLLSRLDRSLSDADLLNQMIKEGESFILYLRDFQSGRLDSETTPIPGGSASGVANPALWPKTFGKVSTSWAIPYFQRYFPVVYLNNNGERTSLEDGIVIYPNNYEWERWFKYLLGQSQFLVVDYVCFTENIRMEIEHIINHGKKNIVLVARGEIMEDIKEEYPELMKLVACICPILDDKHSSKDFKIDFKPFVQLLEKEGVFIAEAT